MTLAIGWLHEAGDPPHPHPAGGSMTLAIGWLHDGGETAGTWLHELGDWQFQMEQRAGTFDAEYDAMDKDMDQLHRKLSEPDTNVE